MQQDDAQLLEAFTLRQSQEAFAQLSRRYVNLVYSSALRQMADAHAAEDVTQAVFIILAQKAGELRRDVILPSWLLQTTAYAVKNAKRARLRRHYHEQKAAQMKPATDSDEEAALWEQIGPALDTAVGSLARHYRDAVVLRFFDQQSYQEVARRLNITEPAARQRISRAVAELRKILAKQGAIAPAVGAGALAAALETNVLATAPAPLAAACAAIAGASQAWPWVIAKGVMTMLLVKKLGVAAMVVIAVVALGAAGVVGARSWLAVPTAAALEAKGEKRVMRPVVEGVVVDASGKAVAGAHVYLADPYHPVTVYDDQQARAAWVETSGHAGQAGYDQKPGQSAVHHDQRPGQISFRSGGDSALNRQAKARCNGAGEERIWSRRFCSGGRVRERLCARGVRGV
jgi:RNA polymerase sigma factor (sigma-70 family)